MANIGNKRARKVKNLGTIYFDNVKNKWVGQVEIGEYDSGRKKYKKFYGDSQNTVIDKMRQYKQDNPALITINSSPSGITLGDYLKNYLITVKKTQLKPSSYTRTMQIYNNQINPILGSYDLNDITAQMIQVDLINSMIKNNYSYSTIHKTYILLNECLKYAHKKGDISQNPCSFVEEPAKITFTNIKDTRFFDDNEIEKFIEAALLKDKNGNYHYRNGLALISIIYSGLRIGELVALKWRDVNLKHNYLRVHSNISISYDENNERQIQVQDSTKSKKSRIVYLTKSAQKYYQMMKDIYQPNNEDFVYYMSGKRDITRAVDTYTYICKRAGIINHQGAHTLRHTCASLLIRNNVDIKIISEMLGHKDVAFTYNTYIHLIEEEKAKTIGQLDI